MLALQLLIGLTRTPRRFAIACGVIGALVVGLTPIAHAIVWADHLPLVVASYLSFGTGSLFPLFPWAGFTLFGAAFGVTAAPWATRDHLRLLARWLFLVGALLAVGAGLMGELGWFDYGASDWWRDSPLSFVVGYMKVDPALTRHRAAHGYIRTEAYAMNDGDRIVYMQPARKQAAAALPKATPGMADRPSARSTL